MNTNVNIICKKTKQHICKIFHPTLVSPNTSHSCWSTGCFLIRTLIHGSFEVTSPDPLIKTIRPTYAFDSAYKKLRDVRLKRRTHHPTTNEHFQFTALSRTRVYLSMQGYKTHETNEHKIPHLVPRGWTVAHNIRPCCSSTKHADLRSTSLCKPLSSFISWSIDMSAFLCSGLSWLFNLGERHCGASNSLTMLYCHTADVLQWLTAAPTAVTNAYTRQWNLKSCVKTASCKLRYRTSYYTYRAFNN